MKWLTAKQVLKHATTPAKARDISIKKYQQILRATKKELLERRTDPKREFLLGSRLCGLCVFFKGYCRKCSLSSAETIGCLDRKSQYEKVLDAFVVLGIYKGPLRPFKNEVSKMIKILKSL